MDKLSYLGSNISSTENDINTRRAKVWTTIDRLSVIWKSDLTNKIKRSFFQLLLKLVDKFTFLGSYLGSSVSSTEKDIYTWLTKAWIAIDKLSIIWRSDLTNKMKRSFFQAAVVSILLYRCTTWTLTKRLEKKLDGNYTKILRAILNKSWKQHPTKHQLHGHLPPVSKTIQVR